MNQQYLALGQDVIFVGPDKHKHKAKISVIYSDSSARVEWANGSAIAEHSDKGGENTFHFEQASPEGGTKNK